MAITIRYGVIDQAVWPHSIFGKLRSPILIFSYHFLFQVFTRASGSLRPQQLSFFGNWFASRNNTNCVTSKKVTKKLAELIKIITTDTNKVDENKVDINIVSTTYSSMKNPDTKDLLIKTKTIQMQNF